MADIRLSGHLAVSSVLYSELVARGLVTPSGGATADMLLYLHECLARDVGPTGNSCRAVTPLTGTASPYTDTPMNSANTVVKEDASPADPVQNNVDDSETVISVSEISLFSNSAEAQKGIARLATLYK